MQTSVDINPDKPLDQVIQEIEKIHISDFDYERMRVRRKMIVQAFVLGVVKLLKSFPQLPFVVLHPNVNIVDMIAPPKEGHISILDEKYNSLVRQVKKGMQSTRSRISPQSRESADAIKLFFSPVSQDGEQGGYILHRTVFCEENLYRLIGNDVDQLNDQILAEIRRDLLAKIAFKGEEENRASPKLKI